MADRPAGRARRPFSATQRLVAALAMGCVGGVAGGFTEAWQVVPLLSWVGAALTWATSVWIDIVPMDADATSAYATREDPRRGTADVLLLSASMAALGAVVLAVLKAGHAHGDAKLVLLGTGIGAIISSWAVVHTLYTLRYAGIYYLGTNGGVNFNEREKPCYVDFAYMSFTIGMTYQVSDTNLTTKTMRHAALRHALLSYLLGTVIIAATINLAAGLAK